MFETFNGSAANEMAKEAKIEVSFAYDDDDDFGERQKEKEKNAPKIQFVCNSKIRRKMRKREKKKLKRDEKRMYNFVISTSCYFRIVVFILFSIDSFDLNWFVGDEIENFKVKK